MKIIREPVSLDSQTQIFVAGYGTTRDYNETPSPGIELRLAQISPLIQTDVAEKVTRNNHSAVMYFDQSRGQGACAGDSGGPTLLRVGSELMILGVNSAVDSMTQEDFRDQEEVTCHRGLRSTSVYAQRDWIDSATKDLNRK